MGLNKTTGQNLVANSVTAVVVFGPDICKALAGRISVDQLIKNSIVGASGLVGAAIGNGFVPFIGGMVGGAVGGFIAKNVMDGFIEDDAKKMFRILKEEFLDGVMLANLTKDEFEEVVQATVANEKLNKMLQNMYASGEYRRYAREAIVDAAIIQVYSKRTMVTDADYDNGVQKLLLEIA